MSDASIRYIDGEYDPTAPNEWLDAMLRDRPALQALAKADKDALWAWIDKALREGHDCGWDRAICGHPRALPDENEFYDQMDKDD
jgi:hypothetical protein